MQDLLTLIASSSNPPNALVVLRRLAVIAPDEDCFERANAAADALAQQMPPDYIKTNEAAACDSKHIDWYIHDAMEQLVDGESDAAKRAQYRDLMDAFDAFDGDPWRMMATLDFVELSPEEFNEAKRITDRLGSMLPDLRSLFDDATRLADKSSAARDVLAPMLSFLSNTTKAAADAHEVSRCRLRPAWADLQDLPDSAEHLRAQAPSMRGG